MRALPWQANKSDECADGAVDTAAARAVPHCLLRWLNRVWKRRYLCGVESRENVLAVTEDVIALGSTRFQRLIRGEPVQRMPSQHSIASDHRPAPESRRRRHSYGLPAKSGAAPLAFHRATDPVRRS